MYFKFPFLFAQLFPKFQWEEICFHMLTLQSIGFLFLFPFNWSEFCSDYNASFKVEALVLRFAPFKVQGSTLHECKQSLGATPSGEKLAT
jgi:hypothetical protein